VERLTTAFETADIAGLLALLTQDVWLTMPPLPLKTHGRELAGEFRRDRLPPRLDRPTATDPGQRPARVRLLSP